MIKLNWWQKYLLQRFGRAKLSEIIKRVLTVPGAELDGAAMAAGVVPVQWRAVETEQQRRTEAFLDMIFG